MKKDTAKPAAIPDSAAETEQPKAPEPAQFGQLQLDQQPATPEQGQWTEAPEHAADAEGARILAEEYRESRNLLGLSETTEASLMESARKTGQDGSEAVVSYLNKELPRHNFYDQPVLLGDGSLI